MYQFITIPKEYASDYRNRLITRQEREMLHGLYQVRTAIRSTYEHHFAVVREWDLVESR